MLRGPSSSARRSLHQTGCHTDGATLYARIGFVPECTLTRWEHHGSTLVVEPAPDRDSPTGPKNGGSAILCLDTQCLGVSRSIIANPWRPSSRRAPGLRKRRLHPRLRHVEKRSPAPVILDQLRPPAWVNPLARCLLSGHGDQPDLLGRARISNEPASRLARRLGSLSFAR